MTTPVERLTEIAEAIRAKDGSSDLIPVVDMAARITALTTAPPPEVEKDWRVRFVDYDGTIIKSTWYNDGESVAALEPIPNHSAEGLVNGAWNYLLSELQEIHCDFDVGANYYTADDTTNIYIRMITADSPVSGYISKVGSGTLRADWGDGSYTDYTNTGEINFTHTYTDAGDYIIKLINYSGTFTYRLGRDDTSKTFIKGNVSRVELSSCAVSLTRYGLDTLAVLRVLVLPPTGITTVQWYAFRSDYSLRCVVIPRSVVSISDSIFYGCTALDVCSCPNTITTLSSTGFFNNCYGLSSFAIPKNWTSLPSQAFNYCYNMERVTIPPGITSIGDDCFRSIRLLQSLTIPASVTTLGTMLFYDSPNLGTIIYLPTTPPTVTKQLYLPVFARIYVPDASLAAYKSAEYWSLSADRIHPLSALPA